jgi:hypothetical protein
MDENKIRKMYRLYQWIKRHKNKIYSVIAFLSGVVGGIAGQNILSDTNDKNPTEDILIRITELENKIEEVTVQIEQNNRALMELYDKLCIWNREMQRHIPIR